MRWPVCAPSRLSLQPDPVQTAQVCRGIEADAQSRPGLGELVWADSNRRLSRRPPLDRPKLPAPPAPVVRPNASTRKGAEHV